MQTSTVRPLLMPVPADCSDLYAAGWAYADNHIRKGGSLNADAPGTWHEERVIGFWDRLSAERDRQRKKRQRLGIPLP